MKKLYLVKMGMDYKEEGEMTGSDVGNYRIRGTFHDKDNNIIFVEFGIGYERNSKGKTISSIKLCVDFQFNTTISWDCNESSIKIDYDLLKNYNYTKADILRYIKDVFGVEFNSLELIDTSICNYDYHTTTGDNFRPDEELIAQNQKIKDYFYNYEKNVEGKQYPNFSIYYNENNKLTVLLHYNCYNDIITIDNPFEFDFNYQKPVEKINQAQISYYGDVR